MDTRFVDRLLNCSDCHGPFVFTAGEQLFFTEKQFKNDPKRCKSCKSRRSGLAAVASGAVAPAAGVTRTETRTLCNDCGVETSVPFRPTQGRPVLCRSCFQIKIRLGTIPVKKPVVRSPPIVQAAGRVPSPNRTVVALTGVSMNSAGARLSVSAALVAATSMASASPHSSVASAADLASIVTHENKPSFRPATGMLSFLESAVPKALVAAANDGVPIEGRAADLTEA